jgi:DNA-binding NtrC family response regulator
VLDSRPVARVTILASDLAIAEQLGKDLQARGHSPTIAASAEEAFARSGTPGCALVLNLPEPAPTEPALRDSGMLALLEMAQRASATDIAVLIEGEPGTGREWLAERIQRARSPRSAPLTRVDCALLEPSAASTIVTAVRESKGAVFLDTVDRLPPLAQAALAAALEAGPSRPKLISAAAPNLRAETEAGRFREDLYYRLGGVTLRLPALRDRPADIAPLASHFADRCGSPSLSEGVLKVLEAHDWPGHVRELQIVVAHAACRARGRSLEPEDLPLGGRVGQIAGRVKTLAEVEREHIAAALAAHGGHRGRAARALGIDPKTLYNKLGSRRPKRRDSPRVTPL